MRFAGFPPPPLPEGWYIGSCGYFTIDANICIRMKNIQKCFSFLFCLNIGIRPHASGACVAVIDGGNTHTHGVHGLSCSWRPWRRRCHLPASDCIRHDKSRPDFFLRVFLTIFFGAMTVVVLFGEYKNRISIASILPGSC